MTSRIRCNLFSKAWRNDPATSRLPVQGWRSRHGGGRVHDRGVFALVVRSITVLVSWNTCTAWSPVT